MEQSDIDYFNSVISDGGSILTDKEDIKVFNTDWMHKFQGYSKIVVRPKTTQQVSKIVAHCNQRKYVTFFFTCQTYHPF